VFHQYGFVAALVAGTVLVVGAPSARAGTAAAVYAALACALLGVSALYHRTTWTPPVRRWLRHLDHAMIFVLIAGTYTPVGLLVLRGPLAAGVQVVVWSGAAAGIALRLVWRQAPSWVGVAVHVALGWVAVVALPQLVQHLGVAGTVLLGGGGLAYSAGALCTPVVDPTRPRQCSATTRSSTCWWWVASPCTSPPSPWPSWQPDPAPAGAAPGRGRPRGGLLPSRQQSAWLAWPHGRARPLPLAPDGVGWSTAPS
jgi:hemolysin III